MKKKAPVIIAVVLLIGAICIFLYPTMSEWINKMYEKESILEYNKTADTLSDSQRERYLEDARRYNNSIKNGKEEKEW